MGRSTIKLIAVFALLMGALTFAAPASVQVAQASSGKVLILDSTVSGGASSQEAQEVVALGKTPVLVNGATWGGMTTAQFASYDALVLGDATCVGPGGGGTAVGAAIANASVWGPAVTGKVLINGTDPVYHSSQGGLQLTNKGIDFALSDSTKTGAYISLSCYYHDTVAHTPVPLLDGLAGPGAFTVTGVGCFNDAHIVATSPALTGITDATLSNWSCSVHEAFDKLPASFEVLAIARGTGTSFHASDGTVGTPYILARGVTVISAIQLAPASGTAAVGSPYTLTATVTLDGKAVVGTTVTFTIVSGPNVGQTATGTTDSSGQATFTYTSATPGNDFVNASFIDTKGNTQHSGNASVVWTAPVEKPITAAGTTVNAVEGQSVSGTVATFNDPDTAATAGEYSASISWGDGSAASAGTIAATGGGDFIVGGSHTYAEEGTFSISVAITDNDFTNSAKATSPAVIADAALTAGKPATVSSTEGQSFNGPVATFADANATAPASEFTATITWGDGSPNSTGTVSGSAGSYSVAGTHTYKEEGPFTGSVKIVDQGGSATTTSFTATVGDAALTATASCPANTLQAFSGQVATFTDANTGGTLADFTATITWGDGTTSTGTLAGSGGNYTVSGSHSYASTGYFTITVDIKDVGGSTASTGSAPCKILVYAFAPGGGSFVIGDKNAAVGTAVTFWGAQWAKANSLSGGSAPNSFKGFAESPTAPTTGATWGADPGNSSPPPSGALPAYMGVIVTSTADKSGPAISGNIVHIVIVKTDAGYAPNPGHAGTGTVVAKVS